jgi:hypothetical protein
MESLIGKLFLDGVGCDSNSLDTTSMRQAVNVSHRSWNG